MPRVTISGRLVREPDGEPLEGRELVTLSVQDPATGTWGEPQLVHTNPHGVWRRQVDEDAVVRVHYEAMLDVDGIQHRIVGSHGIQAKATGDLEVAEVQYRPAGPEIVGLVYREALVDGRRTSDTPFAGVNVELRNGAKPIAQSVTDHEGRFSFAPAAGDNLNLLFPEEQNAPDGELLLLELNEFKIVMRPGVPFEVPTAVYTLKPALIVGEVGGDGEGLEGVHVTGRHLTTGEKLEGWTGVDGGYRITTIPGSVRLTFPRVHVDDEGESWELPVGAPTDQVVIGSAEVIAQASPVEYERAEHAVEWQTLTPEGEGVGGVLVQVWDKDKTEVVAENRTDESGQVHLPVPKGDRYTVVVYEDERQPRPPREYVRDVGSINYGRTVLSRKSVTNGTGSANGDGRSVPESIVDLSAYPILTSDVPFANGGGTSGGPRGDDMAQTVGTEIRNVLGWRWRGSRPDPKGLVDVLDQAFSLDEEGGHTVATWVPRTYVVQSDLGGGITGAQASIFDRAKVGVDAAGPILAGLYALRIDADPEDSKALKAIVANQMQELLSELGMVGGPRVGRVDQMFTLLLGPHAHVTDPDLADGQLGTIRREFGLASDKLVNTVEEEQNVTNFRIVCDYMTGLRQSWVFNRDYFLRGGGASNRRPFFGTQLVLISRQLAVIGDSVEEVRGIMRSVFISDADRETLQIVFAAEGGEAEPPLPMLVEELLSWVGTFAAEEGPRLIQDGGKWAVGTSLVPVAKRLRRLVRGARTPANQTQMPAAYFTPRVQRSLGELQEQLKELVELTSPINHAIPSQT